MIPHQNKRKTRCYRMCLRGCACLVSGQAGPAQTLNDHLPKATSGAVAYGRLSAGFTLVEALVALTLLTVGLIPAFLQAASAVQLTGSIRNSLIAAHLAQEGVEMVRGIRDDNWFAQGPFDGGLTGCDAGCRVQYDAKAGNGLLPLNGNPPLQLDPLSGLYQYDAGPVTGFTRKVTVTEPTTHEMLVISEVGWNDRSGPKTFSLEYHLFDWIK